MATIDTGGLSKSQIQTIVAFERAGASISVFGVISVFIAYALCKRLRTVPNSFIVFASFSNVGASIACLIGYSGLDSGENSTLCQAQAFMFELFMQADPWWSFAMALNVYLVFFFAANPRSFLVYWWAYFLVCYGIPLMAALWLLIVRDTDGDGIYGNATIWCWINAKWSTLRIFTYYIPIWVCIFLSGIIYTSVGFYVFKQRNQLRNLSLSSPSKETPDTRHSVEKRLFTDAQGMGTATTEVTQTTTMTTTVHEAESTDSSKSSPTTVNWFEGPVGHRSDAGTALRSSRPPEQAFTYHTVTRITADPAPKQPWAVRLRSSYSRWCNKFANMDPVKLAYLRTSFIFGISVLVTWTPSSINRIHGLIVGDDAGVSYGLNLASAIVLPLQGVWNTVIFFTTSWKAFKEEMYILAGQLRGLPRGHRTACAVRLDRQREVELERRFVREIRDDGASEAAGSTMRVMRDGSLSSL